jgi:hypothetical protein
MMKKNKWSVEIASFAVTIIFGLLSRMGKEKGTGRKRRLKPAGGRG